MSGMRGRLRKPNTRGESMVVAVVLMLVFFILGLAVLTGASVATTSVYSRTRYRQAYYYAESTLDLLDEGVRRGEIGQYIRERELAALLATADDELRHSETLVLPIAFSDAVPEGLSYGEGATISYDAILSRYAGDPNLVSVSIENVVLSFRADYGGKNYGVRVTYAYEGNVQYFNNAWTWTGNWHLVRMA